MICRNSDIFREDYRVYLEPVLAEEASKMAVKVGCKTRSKFIRYAVINQLLSDGCALPKKFDPFKNRLLRRGVSTCA